MPQFEILESTSRAVISDSVVVRNNAVEHMLKSNLDGVILSVLIQMLKY